MLNFSQSHMIAKMETPQPSSIRKPFDIGQSHMISKIETPQPSSIRKQLDVSQRQIISKMETLQPSSVRKQSGKADLLPSPSTTTRPSIFESQQFSMGGRQVSQAMVQPSIPAHLGPYSSVFSNQQSLEVVISPKNYQLPVPLRFDSQQFEQASKFQSGVKQSPRNHNQTYVNVGTPFTLTSSKHQARQFVGSHQFPSTNVCPPAELPVKFNAEIESVRSKLRESLTSALATVSKEPCNSKSVDVSYTDEEKSLLSQAEASSIQNEIHPSVKDGSLYENTCDYLNSNNQVKNFGGDKELHDEVILSGSIGDQKEVDVVCDVQEGQHQNVVLDAIPLSHSIIEDELLRDHGLCWVSDLTSPSVDSELHSLSKRPKLAHTEGSRDMIDTGLQTSEKLAAQIEAELFKLFGGVNKKYKEKGRSLLFNLKDHSNPELRERVLSGDVPPERLCSMSAEELASKELSQWRQAKAEEFAQMVMLPDMNVDIRRLVRKTHKGEFQVEVEQDDGVQPEVGLVSDVLSKMLTKTNEVDHVRSISSEMGLTSSSSHDSEKSAELAEGGKFGLNEGKDSRFLEKVDCTQEYTIEEMKETKLPPVVSLDEFMQDLDSEPPFQNLEGNNLPENTSAVDRTLDRLGSESVHVSDNQEHKFDFTPDTDISASKLDLVNVSDSQLHTGHIHAKHTKEISVSTDQIDYKYQATDDKMKAESEYEKQVRIADSAKNCSNIWEGFLQLNVSALSNVTSSFLSGEKTSMQGWPDFLEVKGRVRLDAFEKFLQELPLSRSRAIMIVEFSWKEDSMESGRLHLSEAIHSYIADDRVGFAEPAPGVELYLCPPHPKITNMLANHLSKDLLETVCSVVNALLGIVVWRRPHGIISPRLPSHHKHGSGGSKKHSTSKKHQESRPNSNPVHAPVSKPAPQPDEDIDDVPPGFGPPVARDADDLPEFDFSRGNRFVGSVTSAASSHVRELIQKYGHGGNAVPELGIPVQPWNEEDDIPEWYPNQSMKHAYQTVQSLPVPPPPPPPLQAPPMLPPQGFLQPPPFMMNPPHLQPMFHPPSAIWWPAGVQAMPDGGGPMRPCHFGGQPGGPRMPVAGPRMAQGFGFNFWRPDNSGL